MFDLVFLCRKMDAIIYIVRAIIPDIDGVCKQLEKSMDCDENITEDKGKFLAYQTYFTVIKDKYNAAFSEFKDILSKDKKRFTRRITIEYLGLVIMALLLLVSSFSLSPLFKIAYIAISILLSIGSFIIHMKNLYIISNADQEIAKCLLNKSNFDEVLNLLDKVDNKTNAYIEKMQNLDDEKTNEEILEDEVIPNEEKDHSIKPIARDEDTVSKPKTRGRRRDRK